MDMTWAAGHQQFEGEFGTWCPKHEVPEDYDQRQLWLAEHVRKTGQYTQWKFRCGQCHSYVKNPRCEYVAGKIVNERGDCGRCGTEVPLEPGMTEEDWFPWLMGA